MRGGGKQQMDASGPSQQQQLNRQKESAPALRSRLVYHFSIQSSVLLKKLETLPIYVNF